MTDMNASRHGAPTPAAPASPACVACRGALAFFGEREGYTYARCGVCGSIQLDPMPTALDLAAAYSTIYPTSGHYCADPDASASGNGPIYEAVVAALKDSGVSLGRVLDYGCGWGVLLRMLGDAGFEPLGVDYESASLDFCRQEGLPVEPLDLDSLERSGRSFDAVTLVAVFEHLTDHRDVLSRLARLLAPGGRLVILVPTAALFGFIAGAVRRVRGSREIPAVNGTFAPPWHTSILSVDGVARMLAGSPFVLDKVIAAPSGRGQGLLGVAKMVATLVAVGGGWVFGARWPLVLNHIFVCSARGSLPAVARPRGGGSSL